jgi:membrane associated rhomboid family serine protease
MQPATAVKTENSKLVTVLWGIGWVLVWISLLVGAFSVLADRAQSAIAALSGVVGGILFVALAEIIRALQSIEQHLRWRP